MLGYVCPLSWVLPTGCCNIDHAVRFDCRSCLQTTDCCAIYEHCVSCCLRPDKVQYIYLHVSFIVYSSRVNSIPF